MNVAQAPSAKTTPVIVSVGYNLHIRWARKKFSLRDYHLKVDLLKTEYDEIVLYPGTTYLMVHKNGLIGIFDIMLRMWLVPLKFTQIYLTKTTMLFSVYDGNKRGLFDGLYDELTWF